MSGYVFILGAQLAWAISILSLKKLSGSVHPALAMVLVEIVGLAVLLPLLFFFHREIAALTKQEMLWAGIRGIVGVAIGGLLFTYGMNRISVSHASLLALAYPLFAILLGILFMGDVITWRFIVAAALFVGGYLILTV